MLVGSAGVPGLGFDEDEVVAVTSSEHLGPGWCAVAARRRPLGLGAVCDLPSGEVVFVFHLWSS
jgi:hypothetical protein